MMNPDDGHRRGAAAPVGGWAAPPRPPRPKVATFAVWLFAAAIALYAVTATVGSMLSPVMRSYPGRELAGLIGQIVVCLLLIIPMASFAQGRNWARVLLSILGAVVVAVFAWELVRYLPVMKPVGAALMVATLLAAVAAAFAAFHPHTNYWLKLCRVHRATTLVQRSGQF